MSDWQAYAVRIEGLGPARATCLSGSRYGSKERGVDIAGRRKLARLTESLRTRGKGSRVQRLAAETNNWLLTPGGANELKCLRPMSIGFSLGSAFRVRPSIATLVTQLACFPDALSASKYIRTHRPRLVFEIETGEQSTSTADPSLFQHPRRIFACL